MTREDQGQDLDAIFSLNNLKRIKFYHEVKDPGDKTNEYLSHIQNHQDLGNIPESILIENIYRRIQDGSINTSSIKGHIYEQLVIKKLHENLKTREVIKNYLAPYRQFEIDLTSPVVKELTQKYQEWCRKRNFSNVDGLITEFDSDEGRLFVVALYEIKTGSISKQPQLHYAIKSLHRFLDEINNQIKIKPFKCGPVELSKFIFVRPDLKKIILTNPESPLFRPEANIGGYDKVISVKISSFEQQALIEKLISTKNLNVVG